MGWKKFILIFDQNVRGGNGIPLQPIFAGISFHFQLPETVRLPMLCILQEYSDYSSPPLLHEDLQCKKASDEEHSKHDSQERDIGPPERLRVEAE